MLTVAPGSEVPAMVGRLPVTLVFVAGVAAVPPIVTLDSLGLADGEAEGLGEVPGEVVGEASVEALGLGGVLAEGDDLYCVKYHQAAPPPRIKIINTTIMCLTRPPPCLGGGAMAKVGGLSDTGGWASGGGGGGVAGDEVPGAARLMRGAGGAGASFFKAELGTC